MRHPGQLWACPGVWPWRSCDCHNQQRGGIEIPFDCWSAHWGTCGTVWTICHEHTGQHLLQVAWDVTFMFNGILFKLLQGLKCKCEGLYACRSLNVYCIVHGATVMTHLAGAVNVWSCWVHPPTYMCTCIWSCMQFVYILVWSCTQQDSCCTKCLAGSLWSTLILQLLFWLQFVCSMPLVVHKVVGCILTCIWLFVAVGLQSEIQKAFVDFQTGRLQNPEDDVWM